MDDNFTFGVKAGGGVDVVIDGEVHEAPLSDSQPLMAELPPVEAAPEDSELSRLRARLEELQTFEPLIRSIGRGEVNIVDAAPPEPVPPTPEEMAQYFARVQSPRGAAIHEQVKAYAEFLPPEEKAALESIPSRYNDVFDRIANVNQPAPVKAGPGRAEIERVLAAKEAHKMASRTEPAGLMRGNRASFPEMRPTGKEEEIARLKKAIKMHPNDQDLATALASYYVNDL